MYVDALLGMVGKLAKLNVKKRCNFASFVTLNIKNKLFKNITLTDTKDLITTIWSGSKCCPLRTGRIVPTK